MEKKARMEVKITLQNISGDLLWKNVIDLLHHENIFFWCKVYLPSAECYILQSKSEADGFYDERFL